MQPRKRLILVIATGLLITVNFGNANADHTRPNNGKFGGTFLSTRMDLVDRGDKIPAVWSTAEVTGTLGRRTSQAVVEHRFTGVTAACPGGVFIIDAVNGIGFGRIIATFPNGDQIYSRTLTRHQCVALAEENMKQMTSRRFLVGLASLRGHRARRRYILSASVRHQTRTRPRPSVLVRLLANLRGR